MLHVEPAAPPMRRRVRAARMPQPAPASMSPRPGIAPSWTIEQLVAELTGRFDRDRDGRLTLDAAAGQRFLGEAFSLRTSRHRRPDGGVDVLHEVVSIERFARLAESLGIVDGVAREAELLRAAASFDLDGNGEIDLVEHRAALANVGERTIFRWVEQEQPSTT